METVAHTFPVGTLNTLNIYCTTQYTDADENYAKKAQINPP
jgi:hypothetical protein